MDRWANGIRDSVPLAILNEVNCEYHSVLVSTSDCRNGHHDTGRHRIELLLPQSAVCATCAVGRGTTQVCDSANRFVAGRGSRVDAPVKHSK